MHAAGSIMNPEETVPSEQDLARHVLEKGFSSVKDELMIGTAAIKLVVPRCDLARNRLFCLRQHLLKSYVTKVNVPKL